MGIEERINLLEENFIKITDHIQNLEKEKWVTPSELAEIMNCSVNNIYIKIRSGEIYATDKLGAIKRIPMSQFYNIDRKEIISVQEKVHSIRDKVFGIS